jgi:hypothetical protein
MIEFDDHNHEEPPFDEQGIQADEPSSSEIPVTSWEGDPAPDDLPQEGSIPPLGADDLEWEPAEEEAFAEWLGEASAEQVAPTEITPGDPLDLLIGTALSDIPESDRDDHEMIDTALRRASEPGG